MAKDSINLLPSRKRTLDTIAVVSTDPPQKEYIKGGRKTFQKRARAKIFTNLTTYKMVDLKSPLVKSYWSTFKCNRELTQEGGKVTAWYCNQRWCMVCNRIRTAKLMTGYLTPLAQLNDPQFVTLTIPNVTGYKLRESIDQMIHSIQRITKNMDKTYSTKLVALRKLECTFNYRKTNYHPHFHLVVEGKESAKLLVKLWLKQYPNARRKAQDIKPADEGSLKELFKYFTKPLTKGKFFPEAMDTIYIAMKHRKVFTPIGIKKDVSEEIEGLMTEEIDFKENQETVWKWVQSVYDWVSPDGEFFSEYEPTRKEKRLYKRLSSKRKKLFKRLNPTPE